MDVVELIIYRLAEAVECIGVDETAVGHERHNAAFLISNNSIGR